jgi:hypothetical protein
MLMSQLSIDPSSPGAPGEPAAGAAIGVPDGGERFADQLANAQSLLPAGQNLAAGALPLQTVALGPTLEVVTAPHGSPDRDSLAAFAKAQGLDDDVVAWLFSDATQAQVQAQALLPIQIPTGVMALPASPSTGLVLGAAGAAGLTPGAPGLPLDPEAAVTAGITAAVTAASWLQTQQTARPDVPGDVDPAQATATPLPPAFLAAAQTVARGARADAAASAWQPPTQVADIPVEILTLDIQDLESLDTLWDEPGAARLDTGANALGSAGAGAGAGNGQSSGAGTGAGSQAAADDAASPTPTGPRTAGYQELSQRLGEALAQRVIAQIERGNWEVRLLLKPAKLGEVEVDLALRSGALDASFRTTNPVTRDLLNDGLPRLREVLANAGMDIAGLNVGSGRSQQTGGNPTPRHAREPQGPENADRGVVAASAPATQPRLRGPGGSGWDVLV